MKWTHVAAIAAVAGLLLAFGCDLLGLTNKQAMGAGAMMIAASLIWRVV